MKAYGVDKKDTGCCDGHDKFQKKSYGMASTARKAIRDRPRKKRERMRHKNKIRKFLSGLLNVTTRN